MVEYNNYFAGAYMNDNEKFNVNVVVLTPQLKMSELGISTIGVSVKDNRVNVGLPGLDKYKITAIALLVNVEAVQFNDFQGLTVVGT